MAIIYTYPSGAVKADDLIIVSEQDTAGNPTKNITVSALANFMATTGTGTGTTDYIVKWNDGPNGLIGDSLMIERTAAGVFPGNYIEVSGTGGLSTQNLEVNADLFDTAGSEGVAGDVLTSNGAGAGIAWSTAPFWGSGTLGTLSVWTGINTLGDSLIIQQPAAGLFLSTYIETTDISTQNLEINGWLADTVPSTGNAGDVLTSTGGGAAATVTWSPVTSVIPWPYQYNLADANLIQGENPATIGTQNTGYGVGAMASLLLTGAGNVAIGYNAGLSLAGGAKNVIVGASTAENIDSGTGNVIIGEGAGDAFTTQDNNTLIGEGAGNLATSENNTFVGRRAGASVTTGDFNVLIGEGSNVGTATDTNSIAVGRDAVGHGSNTAVIGDANITSWQPGADNQVGLGEKGTYGFTELILVSPDTTRWQITVDNAGNLVVA
tara:strand:+ start:762 stop:2069 length:1308 start_codon:yes stop_codon:yes gene_type:complete